MVILSFATRRNGVAAICFPCNFKQHMFVNLHNPKLALSRMAEAAFDL